MNKDEFHVIKLAENTYFTSSFSQVRQHKMSFGSVGNPLVASRVYPENGAYVSEEVKQVFKNAKIVKIIVEWSEEI